MNDLGTGNRSTPQQQVLLDEVGIDHGAFEVKDSDNIGALGQLLCRACLRRWAVRERARERCNGGKMNLLEVVFPLNISDVETCALGSLLGQRGQ